MPQKYEIEKSPIFEGQTKAQNIRKSPKNEGFRGTYFIPPF